MAASMIPPPIVESRYMPSSPAPSAVLSTTKSVSLEPQPLAARSRERELQADLQFLLDAQAEGLINGLEGGGADDGGGVSTGSTTPTVRSLRAASVVPRQVNRPVRRKLGLRSARKGIYNSIVALAAVKEDELLAVDGSVRDKEASLARIDAWEKKREGLEEAASGVDASEETIRVQRLRQEADVLQEEINGVEVQLAELKTRHRRILKQAAAVENAVQAKLASYTSSLGLLETEVKRYLGARPRDRNDTATLAEGKSVWQLPPQQRTLAMARSQIKEEQEAIREQRQGVQAEKEALEEGAILWKDIAAQVTDFEKRLRVEMASLGTASDASSAWDDSPESSSGERLKELLTHMDALVSHLSAQHILAEERNWRLLIAAIGAELDALKRGREILQSVLGASIKPEEDLVGAGEDPIAPSPGDPGQEIHQLDQSFETARHRGLSNGGQNDMDDEPDPELLFSRQDTDTD